MIKTCRRCNDPTSKETLLHVLGTCPAHTKQRLDRHKMVLEHIVSRIPKKWTVAVEQRQANRIPDLVLECEEEKTAIIIDIKVPFDSSSSFSRNDTDMKEKYLPLQREHESNGFSSSIQTIQVGCLGLVPSSTFSCLRAMGIKGRHTSLTANVYLL